MVNRQSRSGAVDNGRDVCTALRAQGIDAPVVFLTARKGLTNRLSGFSSGGDDYLTKPFAFPELVARQRALDAVLDHLAAVVRHERQLSAELSHELRTPLTQIVAETDLLIARPHTADEVDTAHRAIHDTALAMDRIIETLLTTARAEVGATPGLCPIAAAVGRVLAGKPATGPSVAVDVGDSSAGVDGAVLERILSPIVDNARRHAFSTITISTRRDSESVFIDITDDGPGVPEALRESVFDPGFRADPSDDHLGAGLGLALARRLARAADGDVTIGGSASTFSVRLPPA